MTSHKTNLDSGNSGVDSVGGDIFVWPPSLYFYLHCSLDEYLNGVHEFDLTGL